MQNHKMYNVQDCMRSSLKAFPMNFTNFQTIKHLWSFKMISIKLCDELHIQGTRYVYILLVYWLCLTNAGSSSNNMF